MFRWLQQTFVGDEYCVTSPKSVCVGGYRLIEAKSYLAQGNSGGGLSVVTLQAFTRGKSFHLGKISLGKFTSGFIFPRLKGHTGDHWTLGGLTSQRIKFQLACSKNFGAKMENMFENQTDQRKVFFLFHCCSLLYFQEQDERE